MNFGSNPTTGAGSLSFGNANQTLSFGASQPQQTSGTAAPSAAGAPPAFTLGAIPASTAAPQISFSLPGTTAAASSAAPISLAPNPLTLNTTSNLAANNNTNKSAASLSTTTTTTASANAPPAQLDFCQLEEHINKWTLALEEQEKMFMNQATQVNSWDKVLINNNNKIIGLSEAVEKVKIDQQTLEQELEFIAAQHSELDECLVPLEQELAKTQHLDADKAHTYVLAENLDTQLRQMSEDLKEVIEHLNEANKVQDTSDPIVQIGLILNAHMSSLQWIETSVAQVLTKIDDISGIYDTLRRDNERSIRLTYD